MNLSKHIKSLLHEGCFSILLLLCSGCVAADNGGPPLPATIVFPPRPRLEFSLEEMNTLRNDPARNGEKKSLIAQGEKLLTKNIEIPTDPAGGQWIFYYACPDDNAGLKPESPTSHKCPKCGKVYTDERTNAAYRTEQYYTADRQIHQLALAYAASGDDRFAVPVRDAFLKLTDLYPTLERHDRWGRKGMLAVVGGRRYCQHLDEAVSLIKLARAYDLCCESKVFSDTDRRKIETDFLEKAANEINSFGMFVGGKNNHQTWFNAAYANVGVATGNRDLVELALNGPKGLRWQLQNSVTNDGIWYEGTVSYHFYALQAITETLEALKRIGIDLSGNNRLKSLWLGPLNLAWPDGSMPAINDGDPYQLKSQRNTYQYAFNYFHDPVFAELAGNTVAAQKNGAAPAPLESVNLSDIGIAVLRRGSGPDASAVFLDYGIHGDHHGHPDKMNIILYCLGREIIPDPGRISYSVPEYTSWCRTTIAHNTIVKNRTSQRPAQGHLLFFDHNETWSACLGECDTAYPGVRMKRFLCLMDGLMVDGFNISNGPGFLSNGETACWDWIVHCRGELKTECPGNPASEPLGKSDGYQHLRDIQSIDWKNDGCFDVIQKNGKFLRILLPNETGNVFTGTGIGTAKSEAVPFILRRRNANATMFLTLYDFSGDASLVQQAETLPVTELDGKPAADAVGLKVKGKQKTILIGMDFGYSEKEKRELKIGEHTFRGLGVFPSP